MNPSYLSPLQWYRASGTNDGNPPNPAAIQNNYGVNLQREGKSSQAMPFMARSVILDPGFSNGWMSFAICCQEGGQSNQAVKMFRRSVICEPRNSDAHSNLIFILDHTSSDMELRVSERRRWYAMHGAEIPYWVEFDNNPDPNKVIKIGFVSGDFKDSSAALFFGPLVKLMDRTRFEVFGYANVAKPDQVTDQLKPFFDHYRDIQGMSDDDAAQLIRQDGIDVLVDLSSHTGGNRLKLFCRKPAPLAVSFSGDPTGTGIPQIDALISDPVVQGLNPSQVMGERVAFVRSGLCIPRPDCIYPPIGAPYDQNGHFTFGCLNRYDKISPEVFWVWADILKSVPNSKLFLKNPQFDPEITVLTYSRFEQLGIPKDRLIIRGKTTRAEHMAAYQKIDLCLDPFPATGGITTLEALWSGVPTVTRAGQTPNERVSASLLFNVDLTDFIAKDLEEYWRIAYEWAIASQRRQTLSDLRFEIPKRMAASRCGNEFLYTQDFETCVRGLWAEMCANVTGVKN